MDTADEEAAATTKAPNPEDKVVGELNGLKMYLKKGPYGYYVQLGEDATATTEKPKRSALPKGIAPEELTSEQAARLLSLPFDLGEDISVNSGKFGPYIKQGNKSQSLRGNDNIFNITLERAKELLAGAPERPSGKVLGINPKNKMEIHLLTGRYGPYLKCGRVNYALPKALKEKEPTFEEALQVVNGSAKK